MQKKGAKNAHQSSAKADKEIANNFDDDFINAVRKMNGRQITQLIDLLHEGQLIPSEPYPAIHAFGHQKESDKPR